MTREEFTKIAAGYPHLRIAVVGDFCLDRYLEIDPARSETSIETELPVHNVTNVRYQAGGAGTILNNLAALGVGEIIPIGFCGDDAEGHELHMALNKLPGINLNHFLCTPERRHVHLLQTPHLPTRQAAGRIEPAGFQELGTDTGLRHGRDD